MNRFPLAPIFKLFGLFPFKFNQRTNIYQKNLGLLYYGAFLTLFIQMLNTIGFFIRYMYILIHLANAEIFSVTSQTVVLVDCILWRIFNISTMFKSITSSNKFCALLNKHLQVEQRLDDQPISLLKLNQQYQFRVKCISNVYLFLTVFGTALNVKLNWSSSAFDYLTLVSNYLVFSQFLIGHCYELMLMEKVVSHYRALQSLVSSEAMRLWIDMEVVVTKIAKRTVGLFQLNKYICVVVVLVDFPSYMFLYYAKMSKGAIASSFSTLIWQFVLSIVLVVCYSWHRVDSEVSD